MHQRAFALAVLLMSLAILPLAISTARAEEPEQIEVPNVVGMREASATALLEEQGFQVKPITVAGDCPRVVKKQWPEAGTEFEPGSLVTLQVCIPITVMTVTPAVVGQDEEDLVHALEDAYYIEKEYVDGSPDKEGQVVEQHPAEGQPLPFRGLLQVKVVSRTLRVPSVLGMHAHDAVALLEASGLRVRVYHMQDEEEPAGTVVSQFPARDAEVRPDALVTLGIAGSPTETTPPAETVRVPHVVGEDMEKASQQLIGRGLVGHTTFEATPDGAPWHVLAQQPQAGTELAPGSQVSITVAIPLTPQAGVRMPNLLTLHEHDAAGVVASLGLQARVRVAYSALRPGTVVRQSPEPGAEVQRGDSVEYTVTRRHVTGGPGRVRVPGLAGHTALDARLMLLRAGLRARTIYHVAPARPLGRVIGQTPRPRARVTAGTTVTFVLPAEAEVPAIVGLTREQAGLALESAGLEPEPHGPDVGAGITRVTRQKARAGTRVARGSRVAFAYRFLPTGPQGVRVPNVIGHTLERAKDVMQFAGLEVSARGPMLGIGQRVVVAQVPAAGNIVDHGSAVRIDYRWSTGSHHPIHPPGARVRVPQVVGRDRGAAERAVVGRDLRAHFVGPAGVGGTAVITAQSPAPGTLVAKGAVITMRFAWETAPGVHMVVVPDLLGMRISAARTKLQQLGLLSRVISSGIGGRHVRAQDRPAGARVPRGSRVTLVAGPRRP